MGGILRRLFPGWRAEPPRPDGYLTWAEIEQRYPGEWVFVDFRDQPRAPGVPGGWVVAHSPDRATVEVAGDCLPQRAFVGCHFTGPTPADEEQYYETMKYG